MSILAEIVAYKRTLLESGYYTEKLATLQAVDVAHKPRLARVLAQRQKLAVIAELKAKSPTVSDIPKRDMLAQLQAYERYGAVCVSILTDERYFAGSFERLNTLSAKTALPVLCKDFIVDKQQIDVAKQAGASLVLLIVNCLSDAKLRVLYDYAYALGLEVLVEVHDAAELERAHALNAQIIGINNRDLTRFVTDVETTNRLMQQHEAGRFYISESGIHTVADVARIVDSGIDGLLVGEALMKAQDLSSFLPSLCLDKVAR